jgi:uncharacterized membrane protein
MAGIGFELKKLFRGKGYIENVKAYFVSSLVTVGPMLLCISLTTLLQQLLYKAGVAFTQRELFQAVTVYSFVFSLVVSSTATMLVSRYIADKAFLKQYDRIMSSLLGSLAVCMTLGGILGFLFCYFSPIDIYIKLTGYIFYMELIVIWIQAVYVSLFKDYFKILRGFLYGVVVSFALGYIFLVYIPVQPVLGLLISVDIGFFIIIISYMHYFSKYLSDTDVNIFSYISYYDKYGSLVLISLFYNFGMYSHNFVYWLGGSSVFIADTFRFAPVYDVPMFYANLSIAPALVLFVVSVETSFYQKYRNYYQSILMNGNFHDISTARKEMSSVLLHEISHIMEIQLVFSIIALIVGRKLLPAVGLTGLSIDIFSILVLGCYMFVMMMIIVLLILYFDDRKGALMTVSVFLPLNIILTWITMNLGESYYGTGFFAASLISLIVGMSRLAYYIKNINYFTFCSQPILYKEKTGIFSMLAKVLEKK